MGNAPDRGSPRDDALLAEHLNESLERLPGPAYYKVLQWIHRILEPANYVEIGVNRGVSLLQAREGTRCIGVDPHGIDPWPTIKDQLPPAEIFELESDEFFAQHDLHELLGGPVELAFIDGLHLFEQVLRDFINVEKHSDRRTVVLLHDCLPLDEPTCARERTTDFYCGDVWKAALVLRRLRPDLEMVTVRTAPTGLCVVRGLESSNRTLELRMPEIESEYLDLDFQYYLAHKHEMPEEIANNEQAVREWLRPESVRLSAVQ